MTKLATADHVLPQDFLWTVARYEEAIKAGIFTEEDKIELLYGKIVTQMPSNPDHEYCITLLARLLRLQLGEQFQLREEKSLLLSDESSIVEPDLAVAKDLNYSKRKPGPEEVYLVVEVANSSLERDRTIKQALYAEAGLQEYWIINLVHRQIEVHLQPNQAQQLYESVTIYQAGKSFVSPLVGTVTVADLLPDPAE